MEVDGRDVCHECSKMRRGVSHLRVAKGDLSIISSVSIPQPEALNALFWLVHGLLM